MSSGELLASRPSSGNGSSRKWLDRVLIGLASVTLGLLGMVYASAESKIKELDAEQRTHSQRITAVEEQNKAILRELETIKSGQERTNDKLDRIIERINK